MFSKWHNLKKVNPAFDPFIPIIMLEEHFPFSGQSHLLKSMVVFKTVYELLDALLSQWVVSKTQDHQTLVGGQCLGQAATPSIVNVVH